MLALFSVYPRRRAAELVATDVRSYVVGLFDLVGERSQCAAGVSGCSLFEWMCVLTRLRRSLEGGRQ